MQQAEKLIAIPMKASKCIDGANRHAYSVYMMQEGIARGEDSRAICNLLQYY